MKIAHALGSAILLAAMTVCDPAIATQRAFVASHGSDANTASNCTLANPCRGFTAALSVVDDGGEIVALDAAGYGAVTINKSVNIVANPGFYAGITQATGNDAITIATTDISVTLRGLSINAIGGWVAGSGINMTNGAALFVDNCVISGFGQNGILVTTAAKVRVTDSVMKANGNGVHVSDGATLDVTRSKMLNNTFNGVWADANQAATTTSVSVSDSVAVGGAGSGFQLYASATGATGRMAITRSTSSQNQYGFYITDMAGTSAAMIVSNSIATENFYGFFNNGPSATFESPGNNTVRLNTFNSSGTITTVSGM